MKRKLNITRMALKKNQFCQTSNNSMCLAKTWKLSLFSYWQKRWKTFKASFFLTFFQVEKDKGEVSPSSLSHNGWRPHFPSQKKKVFERNLLSFVNLTFSLCVKLKNVAAFTPSVHVFCCHLGLIARVWKKGSQGVWLVKLVTFLDSSCVCL